MTYVQLIFVLGNCYLWCRKTVTTLLIQVLNKLLALATTGSQQKFASNAWSNMLISTNSVQQLT